MMLSRWVSFGQGWVGLVIHPYPTPWDDPTPYSVLDKSDKDCKQANNCGGIFDGICVFI